MKYSYRELAGLIDHALLHPTMTDEEMEAGCREAAKYEVASVCVKPYFVPRAVELLLGNGVAVGTVIGFPHGAHSSEVKRYETEIACREGATEVDMVVNNGKVFSRDWGFVRDDIRAVVDEAHRNGALAKIIFETDYLVSDEQIIRLCQICEEVGADFVKTSTGFGFVKNSTGTYGYEGATEHNLRLMIETCSENVGVKASGGIRDLDALILCREIGCRRVGASATVAMLEEYLRRAKGGSESNPSITVPAEGY